MASDNQILRVSMLGGCSISWDGRCIDDVSYRSRKPWLLLEYLITFRNREISQEELVDLLYPNEKGANPTGALKTLVYRVRSMLEELDYPDSRNMILVTRGSYAWNTSLPMELDVDQFELACQKASSPWITPDEKLETCLAATDLYKGDFLSRTAGEAWVTPLSTYYHSMYIHLVQTTVDLLMARDRWGEVGRLCDQAIAIDGYEEFFHYHLIRALVRTGQTQLALEQYKKMYSLFYTELGVTPSADLTALYREIIKTTKHPTSDLPAISQFLRQEDRLTGAFFCELEVFKDIYNLEARSAARSGRSMYLCLITATMRDGTVPPLKLLNGYMDKLADCIQGTLRRGDVAAKYSISQYILLLPTSSAENGNLALGRILDRFLERYPRCPLALESAIQPMDILE